MKLNQLLNHEEIQDLIKTSDLRGFQAVLTTWFIILFSFFIVAWQPSVLTIVIALILIGGRHLALAILMHEAAHYSLFKTRRLNDIVGNWLCAYPSYQDLSRYRKHHLKHHRYAGSEQDPDIDLVAAYPTSKASLFRKFLRDLTGVTGLKRIVGLVLIAFDQIEYTVSGKLVPIQQNGKSRKEIFKIGVSRTLPFILTQSVLVAGLWALGHPELYLLWVASYMTTFSLFLRIRSIAEHACTQMDLDPFKNTRSMSANWIERLTVAPHRVNYHLEHHLLMTAPYFKLPELHRRLRERGALEDAYHVKNYSAMLRLAVRGEQMSG